MSTLFSLLAMLLLVESAAAQVSRGTVRESLSVESAILGRPVRYSIYLPFDYETSTRSYPVVYLLHGGGGDQRSWIGLEAHLTADELISTREIAPVILVMPEAGTSRYVNSHDGGVRYEDFFFQELIPHVESMYRAGGSKASRAVAGFSMGGYVAMVYALRHPEMFLASAGLSAAIYTEEMTLAMTQEQWDVGRGPAFGIGLQGRARLTAHYRSYDPLQIAQTVDRERIRTVKLYLDCGDDDFRNDGNAVLHVLLRRRQIPHDYRVRDGGHTRTYWRTGLSGGLRFISDAFRDP